MSAVLQSVLVGALILFRGGVDPAKDLPHACYRLTTARYSVEMRVSFPASYEGRRLVFYRSGDARNEICLSIESGTAGCAENFVGALAVVVFAVNRVDGRPAAASIREVVTSVHQSPGLPYRPPFRMTISLANGMGSDVQVFGYDETSVPAAKRAAEREAAKGAWRHYRQELYIDRDRQPFATIEWLHTTTRIHILRVDTPPGRNAKAAVLGPGSDKGGASASHERIRSSLRLHWDRYVQAAEPGLRGTRMPRAVARSGLHSPISVK